MRRFLLVLIASALTAVAAQDPPKTPPGKSPNTAGKASEGQYEVLNPWAEVDPVPLRPISPRLNTLAGKKIGLFANFKRAARPIAASIEKRLGSMYPDVQTSLFDSRSPNVNEIETKNKDKFTAWVKGVDAVIAVVGD
jgi:hypothetical protein